MKHNYSIPRAEKAEDVGVSSLIVKEFLDEMGSTKMEFHSMMIIRHGKVAVEFYQKPFSAPSPHTMYSGSKAITGIAVGFAIDEGLMSLDTKVIDIFPEYANCKNDLYLNELTIEHLVSMSAGKNINVTTDKSKIDWLEQFFTSPWSFQPGHDFFYVNENFYILSAAIKRVTGMCVRDYLKPRLFNALGIDYPFWETDENGVESGGWGLYLKTEDLAKISLCFLNKGIIDGKQILPAFWANEAPKFHVDNSSNASEDCAAGYGYGLWRCRGMDNAYRFDGMFSQFGIVMEDYDAVVVVTSGIPMEQTALNFIWRFFPKAFFDESARNEIGEADDFKKYLTSFSLDTPIKSKRSPLEKTFNHKTIVVLNRKLIDAVGFPLSMLPIAVTYMTTDKAGNPNMFQLAFNDSMLKLRWTEGDEINTVYCGMDGKMRGGKIRLGQIDYDVCAYAFWKNNSTLVVHIRPYTTIGKRILTFNFEGKNVTIVPESTPPISDIVDFLGLSAADIIKNKNLLKLAPSVLKILAFAVEPKLYGQIL